MEYINFQICGYFRGNPVFSCQSLNLLYNTLSLVLDSRAEHQLVLGEESPNTS